MTVLEARGLVVEYETVHGSFRAVDEVDLAIEEGSTLGLVGESGSGKSTLARALVGLIPTASGSIELAGRPLKGSSRQLRAAVQLVFQDPYSSLNPRMEVGEILSEAIAVHHDLAGAGRRARVSELLELVGLPAAAAASYPFQFSGGQRQRIAIARALAVQPRLLIADEVTSALDVSVQAAILNLLRELQAELGLAYLVISHDLSIVRYVSDQVYVMHLAKIVERGPSADLFSRPCHPYTKALLESVPQLGEPTPLRPPEGEIPDPHFPPSGCRFRTRCAIGPLHRPERRVCIDVDPHAAAERNSHDAACHFPLVVDLPPRQKELAP